MIQFAKDIWRKVEVHSRKTAPLLEEMKATQENMDLTEEAKEEGLRGIRGRLEQEGEKVAPEIREMVRGAELQERRFRPEGQEIAAAIKHPDRATASERLARGSDPEVLKQLIEDAAHRRALPEAAGIRKAIKGHQDLTDEEKGPLLNMLDAISRPSHERAQAEWVAAKRLGAIFEAILRGPDLESAVLSDPKRFLTETRAAAVLPNDRDGGTRTLPQSEVERLVQLAGLPLHPPGRKAPEA